MRPPLDPLAPLLAAADCPRAVLVLGDKSLRGWYETRPAVIDADPESETPGAALWVGSRHLAIRAIRAGCFRPWRIGRRLTEYRLTPEGRSLGRDLAITAGALQLRICALEQELRDVYGTIDAGVECDQTGVVVIEDGRLRGDMSLQTAVLLCLRERLGEWVSSAAIGVAVSRVRADGSPGTHRVSGAVTLLRRRGWLIESGLRRGYRLQSAERGDPAAAEALRWHPAERPQPPRDEERVCRTCGARKWIGDYSWHARDRCYSRSCLACRAERAREAPRQRPHPGHAHCANLLTNAD